MNTSPSFYICEENLLYQFGSQFFIDIKKGGNYGVVFP